MKSAVLLFIEFWYFSIWGDCLCLLKVILYAFKWVKLLLKEILYFVCKRCACCLYVFLLLCLPFKWWEVNVLLIHLIFWQLVLIFILEKWHNPLCCFRASAHVMFAFLMLLCFTQLVLQARQHPVLLTKYSSNHFFQFRRMKTVLSISFCSLHSYPLTNPR